MTLVKEDILSKSINIKIAKEEEISLFKDVSENVLKRINEPERGYFIVESPKVIERAIDSGYKPLYMLIDKSYFNDDEVASASKALNANPDIVIISGERLEIREKLGYELTRGSLVIMDRKENPSPEAIFKDMKRIVVLDNVENPTNMGAIVRSAAALGIEGILFYGGCSDPLFRRCTRVSMGNIFLLPWCVMKSGDYIGILNKMGFKTVAMALTERSVSLTNEVLQGEEKLAVIMGNEGDGLPFETLEKCDYTVKIPMKEGVDSLNVAAAAAVAFWELGNCTDLAI